MVLHSFFKRIALNHNLHDTNLLLISILLSGLQIFAKNSPPAPIDSSGYPLVDSVIASQTFFRTVSCKYHHTYSINSADPVEYQGIITYKKPDKILMHFLYPAEEYVMVDDSLILLYSVANEYGMRYEKSCMSPTESQIVEQIGQIRMNLLSTMRPNYFFALQDSTDKTNTVITATPKNGWKSLGKILITLDMTRRTMKSIELYGKKGPMISSTKYRDFRQVKNSDSFFPGSLTIQINSNGMIRKDRIEYSQIKFNKEIANSFFTVPVSKKAKIVSNTAPEKVQP